MADEKNFPLYVDPKILARDLDNSLSVAGRSPTTPDDESQLRAASRRLGIPLETARTNPAETKLAVERDSFNATDYATRFPTAARYLANPDNALVARDDVGPLSEIEKAIRRQVNDNLTSDLARTPGQTARDRLMPEYAAERREREQVLRTEGFAAASALGRRQQQRRELLRATGEIGTIQQPEATPGNILSGLGTAASTGFKSAKLGMAQQVNDLFSDTGEPSAQYKRQREQLDFEGQLATPEFDTDVARWTYGGFSSLVQTAPALGLSIATGSPALGLGLMGLQTYGESYGRYRGRDASKGMASLGAAGEASVEVLTEILPMKFAVDRLGKAGMTDFLAGFLGRDMAGEQIATLAQDAIDTAIANPTKTWNDYLAERPEAAIQTAFATLVQAGTLAAIGEGAGRLAGTLDRNQYAATAATQGAEQLQALMAAAAASMTRQRDPQTFAQLVQDAAEDSGSAPTEIFIDARVLSELVEQGGMTQEQMQELLPSVAEQLEEAMATNGSLAIPIGEATAAFAGSGLEQQVVQNTRVSEDAWTAAEAAEGADLLAQLEQDAQTVLEEQTEKQAWEDSSNAVFDTLVGELNNAGRFTPDVNRAYATLVRNFYAVQAGKLGITPQEMYERFPLTVKSRAPGSGESTLGQQRPASITPGSRPGELTVQGVHFSKARRESLDGRFFGTGARGAERRRLQYQAKDSPLRSRVLAYVDEGAGVRAEQGVGSVGHSVNMANVYDTGTDPLGIWTGPDANAREQAVLDAGFDGYYVPGVMAVGGGKTAGVVALLGEAAHNVPTREYQPEEVLAQSVSLRDGRETLKKYGLDPAKKHKTRDVAAALEARQRKKYGTIERDDRSEEAAKKISKWMAEEVQFELLNPDSSGAGWYSTKFQAALDTFAAEFPELSTDKAARDVMTALIAITSDGQKVGPNFAQAADIYGNFRESGKFTTERGHQRQASISNNLRVLQELHDRMGATGMAEYLLQEATVSELRKIAKEQGVEFDTAYQAHVKLPMAAVLLGPKLGAFYANLMGASGYLTMDRWWSRTFNRMRGVLIQQPTAQGIARVRELLGQPELSDDQVLSATVEHRNSYEAKNFKNGTELEKAANTVYKAAFEALEDAPFNATDRTFMLRSVELAKQLLKRRGHDISIADIQAILWYYEKRLYGELGARQSADISYEEAARKVVDERGNSAGRSDLQGDGQARSEEGDGRPAIGEEVFNQEEISDGQDPAGSTGDRGGRYSGGSLTPLEGAPTVEGASGPDPRLVAVAEQYARDNGIPLRRQAEFAEVDPERAARIAAAYEAMPHAPQDPAVKEAFENLIQQTMAQYRALEAAGYQFFLIDEATDPYAGNPWNAMRDLRANQSMGVFATEAGFGSGATELNVADNPLLADTGLTWPYGSPDGKPKRVLANDLFRAVHDAFGHGLEGAGFRARGEENAWQAHVRLFTGSALGAITSETRGQNSWLNYGPHGESNQTAKVEDTVFADQKTGLMPEWTWTEGRVADEAADVLDQNTGARATFNPSTLEIALLEKADLSSFLHETGHFFFEMQATLAADPNAPASIVADMEALLDHVGFVGTPAEWMLQPLQARREAHETIAETFEQYLFTGKAPNAEMQAVFRRFRSWLISVYRSLQNMLATNSRSSLNPEVAAVFDRMIATDEAIAAAQAVRQFAPMFRTAEEAGMTPEAWADYQANLDQQQADAIDQLQARTMRDLKWLDNARGRKLKELQKEAAAQRKAVRDEVTAEVNEQPIYKAMEFLKHGIIDSEGEQIQIEVTKAAKLNITELQAMYPEGELGTSADWKKLGYGKYGMLSDAGLHPDTVAEMFGFRSGRQLVKELLTVEPKASVIEGMTEQRMLERYGDISSPEAMAEAANQALANDARARLVATELQAVTKATGKPGLLVRAARQAAEQIVAGKPVRNLRPDLAAASAARARKEAEKHMAKGDTVAAAAAKRTEILQMQLERVQRKAQQEHDKALREFKKVFKGTAERLSKSRDMAMVNAARAVLARYGLAPNTGAAQAQAYLELLNNYDGAMSADIKSILQGLPPAGDFRDLTVEQFRGMRDIVNGLYYLARRTRQMEIDGEKVEIDAIADEMVQIVTDRSGGTIPPLPGYTGTPTGTDKWKASLLGVKASLTRVEFWADNWGPAFKKYIWQPVSEATANMRDKRNALVAQYRDLLKAIEKGITYNKIDAPELGPTGFTFNAGKSELLHAVLHSGNQSNLTKLLLGRGWGSLDANGALDTSKWDTFITRMINEGVLTKADFDFAQGVWDLLETVKKDAQAAHKEMYGYYFNEVTADPINTPFGQYRGGYVPALADSLSSPDMAQKREQEELLHAGNSFMFPTTGKGFTQSRVFYNKPLELDLRAIGRHLDKVSRFAYLEPTIKDVGQLIGNKRIARALNGASPGAISDMLMPWLQRTARQSTSMPGKNPKMNRFFNGLRSRTGLLFMFGNVVNTLQQLTGFSLAALKVPAPKMLRAAMGYLAHPIKMRQQLSEKSPWLAERMANQSYAMQDQIEEILTNPNPYTKFTDFARRHAYFLQQAMQNVMDPIVWTGAYDHAIEKGATEREARRYADEAVRTTQGSFAPEDISALEVQSPFVRLFTQFYGYFNMWGNLLGNEANQAVREAGFVRSSPRLMFIWFAGMAIPAFAAELISRGLPGDEEDEDGDGLLDEYLAMFFGAQAKSLAAMVPIAGHMAVLTANQSDNKVWNDRLNISPALSAAETAGKGAAAIATGKIFDEEFTKTEFRGLLTLLGLGTGLPVAPAARAGGYLFDVESGRKEPETALEMGIGITTGR